VVHIDFLVYLSISSFVFILFFFAVSFYLKKMPTSVDLRKLIPRIIISEGLPVNVHISPNQKACYDMDTRTIHLSEGNSVYHLVEAFHEMGHAVDEKNVAGKPSLLSNILFFVLKYSVAVSVVFHSLLEEGLFLEYTWVGVLIGFISSIFFLHMLGEEISATLSGKALILKYTEDRSSKTKLLYKAGFLNGILSYLFVAALSAMILVRSILLL